MTERLTIPELPGNPGGPYTPPPIGGEPRLYALLAVEVKPGHIVYYHLELDHTPGACTIDMDRDVEPIYSAEMLAPIHLFGPMHIEARISGTVVSDQPDYRPPTRAPSRIDEDALTGYTRPLPLPGSAQ
jgi:hypothetical protein